MCERKELKEFLKNKIEMQDYFFTRNKANFMINNYEIINLLCNYSSDSEIHYLSNYLNNQESLNEENIKTLLKLIGNNIFNFALYNDCLVKV